MAKIPNAPRNLAVLRTGRRGFETTCSPSAAGVVVSGRNVAVIVTDNIAPSVPTGLTATAVSSSQINLAWNASTDTGGSGLAGYRVYRDGSGTPLVQQSGRTYSDTSLTPSTLYSYRISAYDNQGNESALSTAASATTSSGELPLVYSQNFESMTAGAAPSDSFFTGQNSGGSAFIRVDNSTLITGSKNLLIRYTTDASENEQGYALPGGPYTQVTFEYDFYIPSNYSHGPSSEGGATNNKGMRISPVTPASAGANRLGFSFVRNSDNTSSDLVLEWDDLDNLHGGGFTQMWFGAAGQKFIGPSDLGQVMHLKIVMRAATARVTGKGVFQVYKNSVLIADAQPDNFETSDPANWLYGYLFGYANSRFTATTDMRVDNLLVSAMT